MNKSFITMAIALVFAMNCSSAMQKAAQNNDVNAANQLLEKGTQLEAKERLAIIAVKNAGFEFVEFLKSKGYDILEYDKENGRTTLHYTVSPVQVEYSEDPRKDYDQRIKITDLLLKSGANAKQEDKYGIDPLLAALGGDVLDSFIRIADNEKKIAEEKDFPFMTQEKYKTIRELEGKVKKEREKSDKFAKWFNEQRLPVSQIVDLLLKAKADPNKVSSRDTGYHTPLHLALVRNDVDSIKLLTQRKVKLNEKNLRGDTPLHMAAQLGNKEAYNHLISAKADKSIPNKDNHTAYDLAEWRINIWNACAANDVKSIREYISAGGSVNAHGKHKESWGWSPLHVAAYEGNMDAAKVLLDNGADVNILFHPQGEINKVAFSLSSMLSGFGEGLSGLMDGNVSITTPMYFAYKRENQPMKDFLESKGGIKTVSFVKDNDAKIGKWNKNKMLGFPEK